MKSKAVMALAGVGLSVAALGYWLSRPVARPPVAHGLVLFDITGSMTEDQDGQVAMALVQRVIKEPGFHRGSKLFVAVTGTLATAMEPTPLGTFTIPHSNRAIEGRRALDQRRRQLAERIGELYQKQTLRPATRSPIFLAIKRGLAQLKAAGCVGKCHCLLLVRSDGEETEERWLAQAIRRGRFPKKTSPVLDNSGIKVVWCGWAQTRGRLSDSDQSRVITNRRSAKRVDRLMAVWSQLFAVPDKVAFEPFCAAAVD